MPFDEILGHQRQIARVRIEEACDHCRQECRCPLRQQRPAYAHEVVFRQCWIGEIDAEKTVDLEVYVTNHKSLSPWSPVEQRAGRIIEEKLAIRMLLQDR